MAQIQSFYSSKNFINTGYAIDLSLITHYSNMLFDGDTDRVIYSSNAYAFRKRSDNNDGNWNLPFVNFKAVGLSEGPRPWWNNKAYTRGVFIPELETKVIFAPISISYEASAWMTRDDELRYTMSEILFDYDNKTIIGDDNPVVGAKPFITVDTGTIQQNVNLPALINYENLQFDPEYNEQDWLERNNIHSVSFDFSIDTFALRINADVVIPTELIFQFGYSKGSEIQLYGEDYDIQLQYVIDHVLGEVTE